MRVLITGVTGQDGSYLAQQLSAAGHDVFGLVRGQDLERRRRVATLAPRVSFAEGDLLDDVSLLRAVSTSHPDLVVNLASVSAPALAWSQPVATAEVTGLGFVRLVEAVRFARPDARIIQAGSLAGHGPYGAAKTFTRNVAADYRARGTWVSVAVFGGHHSPRRGREFFSRTVTSAVARIVAGDGDKLELGWLGRSQDWGWAPDYMRALTQLSYLDPDDYVISNGEPHTAREWVEVAFAAADMDWRDHVVVDEERKQPTDVPAITAPPDPRLEWEPLRDFAGLARWMVTAEIEGRE